MIDKPSVGGLGFSVVALKNPSLGEVGIFVKEVQPGSIADRWDLHNCVGKLYFPWREKSWPSCWKLNQNNMFVCVIWWGILVVVSWIQLKFIIIEFIFSAERDSCFEDQVFRWVLNIRAIHKWNFQKSWITLENLESWLKKNKRKLRKECIENKNKIPF